MKYLIFIFLLSPLFALSQNTALIQFWDSVGDGGCGAPCRITNPKWNKVNFTQSPSKLTSYALVDTNGSQTTWTVAVNGINDYSSNGISYGAGNSLGLPDTVFANAMYNNAGQIFTFAGLNNSLLYKIEILSSSGVGSGPYSTKFTQGSVSDTVNSFDNLTSWVTFDNVSPSSGSFTVSTTPFNTYSIVDAIRITQKINNAKYYVSFSSGLDANAGTLLLPFKSLAKVKTLTLNPGDSVSLKCGDNWNETLYIQQSGSIGNPITYTSYGTGVKPYLTGFSTITGWVNEGGNIYGAICAKCTPTTNLVVMDSTVMHMAQWPNSSYRRFTSINSSSFTDVTLTGNIVNTTAVIKDERYNQDTIHTNSLSAGVVGLASAPTYTDLNGIGYFFKRSKSFLDTVSEYFIDPITDTLYVYSADSIQHHTVYASTSDTLIYFNNRYNITISNIDATGSNKYGVLINSDSNLVISGSKMKYGGFNIINANNCPRLTLLNDTILNANNNGITLTGSTSLHLTIGNSKIAFNGIIPGAGQAGGGGNYEGANVPFGFMTVYGCEIDNNGYTGLKYGGDSARIYNNYFHNNGRVMSDGGHAYTVDPSFTFYPNGRWFYNNICINGFNDTAGVNYNIADVFFGQYCDGHSQYDSVFNNILANNPTAGIFNHGSNNSFVNNSIYGNGYAQGFIQEGTGLPITNIIFKNNNLGTSSNSQLDMSIVTTGGDLSTLALMDGNNYASGATSVFRTQSSSDGGTLRNFASWKSATTYDNAGSYLNANTYLQLNSTSSTKTINYYQVYSELTGVQHFRTTTVNPNSGFIIYLFSNGYSKSKHIGKRKLI